MADQHTDRWLYDALATAPAADVNAACADPRRTVSYPVYFVTRMDPTNAYHHFEEVMNFFAAMYIYPHKELLQQVGAAAGGGSWGWGSSCQAGKLSSRRDRQCQAVPGSARRW